MNDLQPHRSNDVELDVADLHPNTLALWQQLKPILSEAEAQNRIVFCLDPTGRPVRDINRLFKTTPDAYWFGKPITRYKFKFLTAILTKVNASMIR